jgi:aspartyl-tRNA(Asn)/glutamyl-tRNA(Gln) amidotransferase subunit C
MSSKPSLQKEDIEKIAHLARLGIDEADVADYARELSNILGLVEQMSAVDTDGVTPMAHPLDAHQRLRDDVVTEQDQRELLQANAPQVDAGVFLVPQVIE